MRNGNQKTATSDFHAGNPPRRADETVPEILRSGFSNEKIRMEENRMIAR